MTVATPPRGNWVAELGRFLEIQNLGLNLPFGLAFLFAAAHGAPSLRTVVLVLIALLAARNAGHAFNRWADRALDAMNPRTQGRALVTGRLSPTFALAFAAVNAAGVVIAAALLNLLALVLAPVALAVVFGYSYTKRFSSLTTLVLGLVEAAVPAGVFIAVTGGFPPAAGVAVLAMLAWGTAFEIIHSLGDVDVDRSLGLRSLPLLLGVRPSLVLVPLLHAVALALLWLCGLLLGLGVPFEAGLLAMAGIAGYTDLTLRRQLPEVRAAFERHFLLAAVFLGGVLLGLAFPGVRL